jgi:hypothetical protein
MHQVRKRSLHALLAFGNLYRPILPHLPNFHIISMIISISLLSNHFDTVSILNQYSDYHHFESPSNPAKAKPIFLDLIMV